MSRDTDKQARAEAMLGELAELGLMVARELAVRVRGCEDPGETVALAGAFHQATRVVRLTLALDAKLAREAARDAAQETQAAQEGEARAQAEEARAAAALEPADPVETRKARVRSLLNRLLWNESERDEEDYEVLVGDLNARLDEAALSPDFEVLPIETLTRRLAADMDLTGPFALSLCEPKPVPAQPAQPADTG